MEGLGDGAGTPLRPGMPSSDSQHSHHPARPPSVGGPSAPHPAPVYSPYTFSTGSLASSHPAASTNLSAYRAAAMSYPAFPHRPGSSTDEAMLPSPSSSRRTSAADLQPASALSVSLQSAPWTTEEGDIATEDTATSPQGQSPKIIQKADRSCKKCRERRVRCGREFPTCARCKKRRDVCNYGEGVYVEETVEGSDQQRIADLEGKITTLQTQLRSTATHAPSRPVLSANPTTINVGPGRHSLAADIAHALTDSLPPTDFSVVSAFLAEESHDSRFGATYGSIDYRLASDALAHAITCYLLDAATKACDSKLPALGSITSRVPLLKANLHELDPHDQVNVATLCALGARTSSNSAFFGVASVASPGGTSIPAMFAAVGSRRETLCKVLEKRARDTAWDTGLFRTASYEAAEAVAALTMLSLHEENDVEDTRWLVRQAVSLFLDLRHAEMISGATSTIGKTVGLAVFFADAQLAVRCGRPTVISPLELQDYWGTSGLVIPDLVNARLPEMVDAQLRTSMSYEDANQLIATIFFHVYACYRVFAQVTSPTPRRTSNNSILSFIRNLWNLIDQIHNAIQRLQQHLVSLTEPFPGSDGDAHAADHAILLAVLADDVLVHLVGYIHAYLLRDRSSGLYGQEREGDEDLLRARGESQMRLYKCLKLFAFYCQLYCGSQDKHNVFHLLMQFAPLANWTELVALRIGQPDGPASDEFEVSEEEVEWFRSALELSLFYSPRLGPSLEALLTARQKYMQKPAPAMYQSHICAPPTFRPPVATLPHLSLQDPSIARTTPVDGDLHYPYSPTTGTFDMPAPVGTATAHLPHVAHVPTTFSPTSPSNASQAYSFVLPHSHAAQGSMAAGVASRPTTTSSSLVAQEGFADGAADDLMGSTTASDVRSAFRSVDWADLSLTPAPMMLGSDGSADSTEEWMRGGGNARGSRAA